MNMVLKEQAKEGSRAGGVESAPLELTQADLDLLLSFQDITSLITDTFDDSNREPIIQEMIEISKLSKLVVYNVEVEKFNETRGKLINDSKHIISQIEDFFQKFEEKETNAYFDQCALVLARVNKLREITKKLAFYSNPGNPKSQLSYDEIVDMADRNTLAKRSYLAELTDIGKQNPALLLSLVKNELDEWHAITTLLNVAISSNEKLVVCNDKSATADIYNVILQEQCNELLSDFFNAERRGSVSIYSLREFLTQVRFSGLS